MKPVRFSSHAEKNLVAREIPRAEAEAAVRSPQGRDAARASREVVNRVCHDAATGQQMLLRVVIEEAEDEIVVVTLYKTSELKKYLGGTAL